MAEGYITETVVLQLHSMVMNGLLRNVEEGLPEEYRKVSVGVHGSQVGRALTADVHCLMSKWYKSLRQEQNEHIVEFLTRIHSEFQFIHPFIDGNGRIGRLVVNLFLLKAGYPILVFPTTMSNLFNHGVEMGHRGKPEIFSRLLAESLYASLQLYEDALESPILPNIEDVLGGA